MVHCSMSSLGWVAGGATSVVDALTSAVGDQGRLIMTTFTYQCDLGTSEPTAPPRLSQRYRADMPSSRQMGRGQAFRCRSGTSRIHLPG